MRTKTKTQHIETARAHHRQIARLASSLIATVDYLKSNGIKWAAQRAPRLQRMCAQHIEQHPIDLEWQRDEEGKLIAFSSLILVHGLERIQLFGRGGWA
jgi:hypothetical protein